MAGAEALQGYAITSGAGRPLEEVKALLDHPRKSFLERLLVREKTMADRDLLPAMTAIRELLPEVPLMVSNRADLAVLAGFDGVQCGVQSLPLDELRKAFPDLVYFASVHDRRELEAAKAEGAEGFTLAPVFATPSKAGIMDPLGIERAMDLLKDAGKPVYLLGGMDQESLTEVAEAGATRFAAIRFFFSPGT